MLIGFLIDLLIVFKSMQMHAC